ncbi:MAG: hypothetical protein Q4D62_12125 [Planctomycetia bacterium]|nr:hypothetical protein [Planctomycetia bacterium]
MSPYSHHRSVGWTVFWVCFGIGTTIWGIVLFCFIYHEIDERFTWYWKPEKREYYEMVLNVTFPETLEWLDFQDDNFWQDRFIFGEFLATSDDFLKVFPPERFPLKETSLTPMGTSPLRDGYTCRMMSEKHWQLWVEIPPENAEDGRFHVWFKMFL